MARRLARQPNSQRNPTRDRYRCGTKLPKKRPSTGWYLPTPDGGVVVFDALRTITDARAAVSALQRNDRTVRGILLTHPHPDHVTGVETFKQAFPNARIYSTVDAVAYLGGKGKTLLAMNVEARGRTDATDVVPKPDVLLRDGQRLMIGGLEIHAKLLGNGESPGATVYYVPSMKTLVVGDVLTPRRVPLMAAGRTAHWLKQIDILRRTYDLSTHILPGHGPAETLGTAADWQEHYIRAFRAEVERATQRNTDNGICVTAAEGEIILSTMRRNHPTDERVARMPAEALDALNLEGVGWEFTRHTCPGATNPIR